MIKIQIKLMYVKFSKNNNIHAKIPIQNKKFQIYHKIFDLDFTAKNNIILDSSNQINSIIIGVFENNNATEIVKNEIAIISTEYMKSILILVVLSVTKFDSNFLLSILENIKNHQIKYIIAKITNIIHREIQWKTISQNL